MPFKEKSVVRHKLRPDWGAGRVLLRNDDYLQIDFTAGGLKKLKTSIADEHLEAATDEEVKALKPPKVKAVRASAASPAVAAKPAGKGLVPPAKGVAAPAKGVVAPGKGVVAPAKGVAAPAKAAPDRKLGLKKKTAS